MSLSWIKNISIPDAKRAFTFKPFKKISMPGIKSTLAAWAGRFSIKAIKKINREKPSLGIILGRNRAWAIHASTTDQSRQIDWVETCTFDTRLFSGMPDSNIEKQLGDFFKTVSNRIGKEYLHIQVSLPDPAALIGYYPIDSVPRKPAECRELACWRIKKQFHAQEKNLASDYQLVGESDGKQVLMAVTIDADWLYLLQQSLLENDLLVPTIDLSIHHRFNQLEVQYKTESGALIDLAFEYWSVIIWDKKGNPRFFRSRWRKAQVHDPASDVETIANEIIQALLVYSHDGRETGINTVLIAGQDAERKTLADYLQQHMLQPVKIIDNPLQETGENSLADLASLPAVAGALVTPR